MNRLFPLALALLLTLTASGCVGKAAAPDADPTQTSAYLPGEALALPDPPPETAEPADAAEPAGPEGPYVRIIDPSKPMVALTFDDGPDGVTSAQILDILEENHALATFFEVGRNVARYPEPVKRMAELGCEVASHSNAHKNLSNLGRTALLNDLAAADQAFVSAGVDAPELVRPPYGAVNQAVKNASGRAMITWTVDTLDWKSRDAQTVVDYIQNYGNLDGEIVLMHSIYGSTVEAVRTLVPWLQAQGYQLVTVTELMAFYYGELPQADHFYGYTYFTSHGRTDAPVELPSMFPPVPEEPAPETEETDIWLPAAEEPSPAAEADEWLPTRVDAGTGAADPAIS